MELHEVTKITTKQKRRLGQGHGTGRVKTAGRGTKGQKARNSVPRMFEGGALPLIKRLPFLRGKGRNNSLQTKPVVINVASLNSLPKNAEVTIKVLVDHNILNADEVGMSGVKILGDGELTTPLVVMLPVSKSAAEKIVKAGGRVEDTVTGQVPE